MKVSYEEIQAIKDKLRPEFEKSRRATRIGYILFGSLIMVLIFTFLGVTNTMNSSFLSMRQGPNITSFFLYPVIIIIAYGLIQFLYISPKQKEYKSKVKDYINDTIFTSMFDDVSFSSEYGYDESLIRETGLVDLGNRYYSNDFLQGSYKSVNFSRADVLTESETTDSDGHSHTTTLFKGQTYQFKFNKNTQSYVRIRDRSYFLSGKFSKGRKIDSSKPMKFEDQEFNEMFYTVSNDPHEAFYIFTPHFMNRVKNLRRMLGDDISLVVRDSVLYLAVYTDTDSYEISSSREISSEYIEKCIAETSIIKYVVDELNLDSDIYVDNE
ncbi:DUF3137 domain-containing protein [Erysipelothrix sp. HDW6A]|uniref:DUF3137 domain-containing protein n=1 Tax=Erysipelothrix sp. HDW6A TaxID=2714928 RepID=UPI00140C345D|nr:DUF3137 domain-containing protein [Erysipelothrix sp. HDW6A]QIK56946.1 DUF3137 domain-containing protein [Erysipelothrix sp. HDW6A]